MANLIAKADGNWTASTSWGVAEAGSGAAMVTRSASTSVTGTGYTWSSAFTCTDTDVLQGILLHLKRNGTTGTITVGLSADNGTSAAAEVTVNASDLPADAAWVFFSFGASPVTADGGNDYKVGVKCSSGGSGATVYHDGTAGNWSRVLRTAAEAAPNTGDGLYIAKEWTGAATGTARTVTMDAVATSITDHGSLDIGQGGTLTFGSAESTNYYLRLSGDLNVWSGGTLAMGTVATPIPASSTAKLNFDCASNVQYGLLVKGGGTFIAQGASKTVWTYLAADAAINATSLITSAATGWADNDEIAIAGTTRTAAQAEKGALNGAASGTSLSVDGFGGAGGGLAYAHSGTAPTRAHIINLTRPVAVFGASTSYNTYVNAAAGATLDWDYAEFYWCGSATGGKSGIDLYSITGQVDIHACSIHDFTADQSRGIQDNGGSGTGPSITDCCFYNINMYHFYNAPSTATFVLSGNICIRETRGQADILLSNVRGTITDNVVANSAGVGWQFDDQTAGGGPIGTFSGNVAYGNGNDGFSIGRATIGTMSNLASWRNVNYGFRFGLTLTNLLLDGLVAFGNSAANVLWYARTGDQIIKNLTLDSDASFSTPYGLYFWNTCDHLQLHSSTLGGTAPHASGDVFLTQGDQPAYLHCSDVSFGSTPAFVNLTTAVRGSFVRCQRYGQTAGDHRTFYRHGTDQTDATLYHTAAPSERLTPASASVKLESGPKRKTVANGGTATFSVYVRKSVVGDGTAYAGAQPRLVLKANPAAGINADVVLDTATAASDGDWEQLTGTSAAVTDDAVLSAVVDCDGTGDGWVNTDDWS